MRQTKLLALRRVLYYNIKHYNYFAGTEESPLQKIMTQRGIPTIQDLKQK